jgi:hypothetical protein
MSVLQLSLRAKGVLDSFLSSNLLTSFANDMQSSLTHGYSKSTTRERFYLLTRQKPRGHRRTWNRFLWSPSSAFSQIPSLKSNLDLTNLVQNLGETTHRRNLRFRISPSLCSLKTAEMHVVGCNKSDSNEWD